MDKEIIEKYIKCKKILTYLIVYAITNKIECKNSTLYQDWFWDDKLTLEEVLKIKEENYKLIMEDLDFILDKYKDLPNINNLLWDE